MKPKQLLILVAVLAVLGLVAFIAGRTGGSDKPDTAKLRGQDVLEGWGCLDRSRVNTCKILGSIPNWIDPVLDRSSFLSCKRGLNRELEKLHISAYCHIIDLHKLCVSQRLYRFSHFDLASTIILIFSKAFHEFFQ